MSEQATPRTIVVKIGGATLKDAPQIDAIAGDLLALRERGDHLVVVHGADPETVHVNDPRAPDATSVPRRYPADDFSRAWLRHRGAAYILLP